MIMPGGKPTMFFACLMFGQPGAEILYPNPGFPIYESSVRFSGATAVPYPLRAENGFAFSAEEEIGRAHVCTPVTNAQLVCRLLLETNKQLPLPPHTRAPAPTKTA